MARRMESGETVRQISEELMISEKYLYNLERRYNEGQSLEDKPRSGRKRKVTIRMETRVLHSYRENPFQTSKQVKNRVNMGFDEDLRISDRTVRRIALKHGLHSRRPCFKTPLSTDQMALRLEFAKKYQKKDMRF